MVLAHQHLGQLPTDLRQAVLANARTKVIFQTSADDARTMAREFGTSLDEYDFMYLGRFEALARIATGDGVSAPLSLATSEPKRGYGRAKQLVYESRKQYGRQVGDVERQIAQRRTATLAPGARRKPKLDDEGWDE